MGVSPRRLEGWEPRVFTDYEYDETGALIRSVVSREAEWDQDQVALMLAAERMSADIGPHGQPMSEATSSDADPAFMGGHSYRLKNQRPVIDRAERALVQGRDAYEKAHPGEDTAGYVWQVERVDFVVPAGGLPRS